MSGVRIVPGEPIRGHRFVIQPPAFSPDGSRFVAGDEAGELIVRERSGDGFQTVARVHVPAAGPYSKPQVRAVAWPRADLIVAHEYGAIRVRGAGDLAEVHAHPNVGTGQIAVGSGGTWLAALSQSWVYVLELPGLERRGLHLLERGGFEYFHTTTLAADPAGPLLAVGDDGGCDETAMGARLRSGEPRVTLLDADRGEVVGALEVGGRVHHLVWDPWRGRIIAAIWRDVEIWTVAGKPVRRFRPYDATRATTFAIGEHWLATAARHAYNHAALDVWDAAALERLASIDLPGGIPPRWIAFTPDGRTLLTPRLPEGGDFGIQPWSVVED
jgi:hypothetical protein